jgi:hypothetical protein
MKVSRWAAGLRPWCEAARLLKLRVRMQPVVWMSVCCEWCGLPGRDTCVRPIPRPEESYRLVCVGEGVGVGVGLG